MDYVVLFILQVKNLLLIEHPPLAERPPKNESLTTKKEACIKNFSQLTTGTMARRQPQRPPKARKGPPEFLFQSLIVPHNRLGIP